MVKCPGGRCNDREYVVDIVICVRPTATYPERMGFGPIPSAASEVKLEALLAHPVTGLRYLERFVNDGSPSGFTYRFPVSLPYSPSRGKAKFRIPIYCSPKTHTAVYGHIPSPFQTFFEAADSYRFPLHPDVLADLSIPSQSVTPSPFYAYPTASGRTLHLTLNGSLAYFKLHHNGIIGRVRRGLPHPKAIAGVEVSNELLTALDASVLPSTLAIFLERFALTAQIEGQSIGFVFRDGWPYPRSRTFLPLIPFFSLFSRDVYNDSDAFLLVQLLANYDAKKQVLLDAILFPVVRAYVLLITRRGLLPEINAQNILLELDGHAAPRRVVLRDMMGIEKDNTIRRQLGLGTVYASGQYKVIDKDEDLHHYYVRHSFSYDFKLSQYIFAPLISLYARTYNYPESKLVSQVREYFCAEFGDARREFFRPYDVWYAHDNILLDKERPYIVREAPAYR